MTRHIGLVCTASTTYNEPYHIARKFASLDHISGGRAGWNIVTSWSEQEAWNFSRDKHLDYDTRYERAREFVDVVTGLMGDLSGYDLDGPVPEPVGANVRSMAYGWWERATREGLSIREMCSEYAIGEGFRLV